MAPNLTAHFWAANDINNATPILEITDEDEFFRGFKLTPDLFALGGWELTLARKVGFSLFDSGAVQPEVFVRFLLHAWSDTEYYFGGLLQKRNQIVVHREEQGEETFTFGGPGPKAYMDRYRLGIEQLTGTGWNLDLENGVWRWNETATAGRVLNRVVAEDAAQDDPALPDLSKTFTDADDSNSDPWTNDVAGAGEYEIPIGQSLLTTIYDLEDLSDLFTTVDLGTVAAPLYRLEAWEAFGDDVTGGTFGAGVGLLREGVNIANDSLVVEGVGIRKCTHVIVEGKDGAWATAVGTAWSSGEYVKWGKIEYTRSSNVNILERAGLRWLRRQDNGDKQITVEIVPGASEATGFYFPGPGEVLWPGNTITLDTAEDGSTHTPLDYNNEPQLLTGLELVIGPAGDTASADKKAKSWDVKVRLNGERAGFAKAPDQTSAASGGGKCHCPSLCHSGLNHFLGLLDASLKASDEEPGNEKQLACDGDEDTRWTPPDGQGPTPNHWWAADLGSSKTGAGFRYFLGPSHLSDLATAGIIYGSDDAGAWSWLTDGGGKLTTEPEDNDWILVGGWTGNSSGETGLRAFSAPVTFRYWLVRATAGGGGGSNEFDISEIELWDSLGGGDARAAACDHHHTVEELLTGSTDTDVELAPDGEGGVEWVAKSAGVGNLWAMSKTSSQTLTNNTETAVTFERADIDGGGSVIDLANERFVAPATGFYLANVIWIWEGTDPGVDGRIIVQVGGATIPPILRLPSGDGNGYSGLVPLSLTSGDFVTLRIHPGVVTGVTARGNAAQNLSSQMTLIRIT